MDEDNNDGAVHAMKLYLLPDPALEELGDVEDDGEESDGHDVGGQAPAVGARVAGHAAVLHRLVHRDVSDRGSI